MLAKILSVCESCFTPLSLHCIHALQLIFLLIVYFCCVNREPSGLLVPLELKDPPDCRVCLEKEEVLAFLDPRETE